MFYKLLNMFKMCGLYAQNTNGVLEFACTNSQEAITCPSFQI